MADPTGVRPSAPRPSRGGIAASATSTTLKGALLVVAAIVVGVVLLNLVDDGTTTPKAAGKGKTTTSTKSSTTASTKPTQAVKKPAELAIVVLNGGGPQGSAAVMSEKLKGAGYTSQAAAGNEPGANRAGNFVFCRKGLKAEMAKLGTAVGGRATTSDGTGLKELPQSLVTGRDCVVVVGAPKG